MVNRYEKISKWLQEYTPRFRWIYFNVTTSEADNLSLNSVQNERELDKFIDGSRRVEFLFALDLVKEYDTGTSSINLEANREFETISEWVELMNKKKHFPDFGENVLIEQIDVLETVPSVTVDTQAGMAKYQGQFKITYMEMKGE